MSSVTAVQNEIAALRAGDRFNAFVQILPDPPVADGAAAGAPLTGLSVAVKDNISVRGLAYTAGEPLFAQRLGERDAESVLRLRRAGARVLGVTRTDAGGFGVTTPEVVNPVDTALTVGGSSGGAAAAVAGGLADIGLGTDTGGSVRIPAACCGIFGYKPSFEKSPADGVWPMAPAFDHAGIMARTLEHARLAGEALIGESLQRPTRKLVAGFDPQQLAGCDAPVQDAVLRALDPLRGTGIEVREVRLPAADRWTETHGILVLAQTRPVYAPYWPQQAARLAKLTVCALREADLLDEGVIRRAERDAEAIRQELAHVFEQVDLVLAPTLSIRPPRRGERRVLVNGTEKSVIAALVEQTCLANLTGVPALAAPLLASPSGPPAGSLQIMAAAGRDAVVFEAARQLSEALRVS